MEHRRVTSLRLSLTASALCLVFSPHCSGGQAASSADSDTVEMQEAPLPRTVLWGVVSDLVTGNPVAGVRVSIGGKSITTDAKGRYSIAGLPPGTNRMEITGSSVITRSLMVRHGRDTSVNVSVKASNFNNAMFWASASHSGHIMRWRTPPRWVLYSQILDSDPPVEFPPDDLAYLRNIIEKELPKISEFFSKPSIEVFRGRPNDDPRWTGKTGADGCILCAPAREGGGHAGWRAPGYWVRYAKVRTNFVRAPKVWRHEIGHALGMGHAFDNKEWLPHGDKDPNYRSTKLHDRVELYTDWDKLWLHCVYSGSRPAGNTPPDRDPDDYIHGHASLDE